MQIPYEEASKQFQFFTAVSKVDTHYYGRDPQDRPVYTFEDGRFVKDVSATWPTASLCYATNNTISGEPDEAVTVAVKLLPQRMT